MTTFRQSIIDRLLPDASIFWQTSTAIDANDRFPHELIVFKDTATKVSASGLIAMPKNYSAATVDPKLIYVWRTTSVSGDVRWAAATAVVRGDNVNSFDVAADTEVGAVTDTAGGAAHRRMETSITLTKANYAADDSVLVTVSRDGANAADTMTADAYLEDLLLEYADA